MSLARTSGPLHTGGTFNPGTPDEHCTLWSEAPPGMQSGDMVAQYVTLADADRIVQCWNSFDALTKALVAAMHALRSYQSGNDARELAKEVADAAQNALVAAGLHTKRGLKS